MGRVPWLRCLQPPSRVIPAKAGIHSFSFFTAIPFCDRHGLNPNVFYRWQKLFFENEATAFAQSGNGRVDRSVKKLERQNLLLQSELADKDGVIAELVEHNIDLKKR